VQLGNEAIRILVGRCRVGLQLYVCSSTIVRKQPDRIVAKAALPIGRAGAQDIPWPLECLARAGSCGLPFRGLSMLFGNRSGRAHVCHEVAAEIPRDGKQWISSTARSVGY
jgi:hypothetical protein